MSGRTDFSPDHAALRGIVDEFLRQRAAVPGLDPEEFGRGYPPPLRDEVVARCTACLVFGPPAESLALGRRELGDFELLAELGRGGMGIVYLARQRSLDRLVAVKVLPGHLALTRKSIEGFRREAAAVARLRHPGIVQVHTVGEAAGVHFFAMDYVRGQSLRDWLDQCRVEPDAAAPGLGVVPGRGPVVEIAEVVARVAEALHHAHEHGVIHRDVKPGNILVSAEGEVRLVDFGLAKHAAPPGVTVTRSGDWKGTPPYMSPEQLRGRAVDSRTDVFSLGVVLYELLTLTQPFEGRDIDAVHRAILTRETPPIRRRAPWVPRDLETVCMKALEKDVRHRYASAGELAADLRRFLRLEPIHAAPAGLVTRAVKRIRRHRRAAALVAVAVASLAALWIAAAVGDASARARARQELAAAATARRAGDLTAALDHARAAVQQAPGDPAVQAEHEVYRELWRQEQRLRATKAEWIESLRLLTLSQQVRDTDPGFALLLAVEGSRRAPELLFERSMANDALLQALGGLRELRTLTGHLEGVTAACFDARGETVVTAGVDWTARLWDARDGRQRAVLGGHRDVVHAVAFDPTGKRVVTASADRTARVWDVGREAVDLVLRGHRGAVRCARFAPDGATIATGGDDGTVRIWDAATGEPRHRLDAHAAAVRALDFAADGTRLVTGSDDRTFRMLDLGTGETSFVSTPEQSGIVSVALDRAARRVAVASGGSARVWNLVRGEFEARLAAPATPNNFVVSVAFGSDGRVAAACWDGVARVLDESGAVLELRGHQRQVDSIAFSPDATRVVTASADGTARIWSVVTDPAAETPRVFGPDVRAAVFRPDGEVLALSSRTSGRIRLHATGTGELVGTLATGDRARLLPPATFSAAGDRVLAPASDHSVRISTPAGADEVVLGPHGGAVCSATFDPTGEHVATVALDDVVRLWDSRRGDLLANWPAGGARRVRFLANGRLCGLPAGVFGYHDPADDRWHLTGPSPVRTFERDAAGTVTTPVPDDVMMAAVGSDGARLVAVRGNETVLVDMATGKQLAVLAAIGAATHTGFSADGRLVVLCMLDAVAFVHDSTDGARLLTLTGHQKPLTFAEFDRGATRVVTASMDGTARTWDCRSGSEQSVLRHGAAVVFCHYSPCGRFVSTVGFDGTARLWPARPLDAAETRRPRELTADDRRRAALWSDAERAAAALVARLFEERDTLAAVTAAIVDDPSLAEPVRAAALEQARAHGDRPWRLERAAWAVARSPSSSGAELAVARRRAAAAVGLVQDHAPFLSTLGAACYRLGELAEAERCLAAAAAADPAPPVALAFLAMTRHRRGATDSACATLARLDALLPDPEDHELAALCSEARALLSR